MKFKEINPPREFETGFGEIIKIKDCGRVELEPDEQVTFTTPGGAEYDLARKDWGFYATPSLNGRLKNFALRGVMIKNRIGRYFIMLVEAGKEDLFRRYLDVEGLEVVTWLDDDAPLERLERRLAD